LTFEAQLDTDSDSAFSCKIRIGAALN